LIHGSGRIPNYTVYSISPNNPLNGRETSNLASVSSALSNFFDAEIYQLVNCSKIEFPCIESF